MPANWQQWKPRGNHDELAQEAGYSDWKEWCAERQEDRNGPICGRMNSDKMPCKATPMANGVCKWHGGNARRGPAHPAWKPGDHERKALVIKALPDHLVESFMAAAADEHIIELTGELALARTRKVELVEKLRSLESQNAWGAMASLVEQLTDWLDQDILDKPSGRRLAGRMRSVVSQGFGERSLWSEIMEWDEHARKLAETELKRRKVLGDFFTAQQGLALVEKLVDILARRVDDKQALSQIIGDLEKEGLAAMTAGSAPPEDADVA